MAGLRETHLRRALDTATSSGRPRASSYGVTASGAEEALDLLRRAAQDLNLKLAELARTLASRHTQLDLPQR